jgi:tetratricopeptide (TPR) repeat protein
MGDARPVPGAIDIDQLWDHDDPAASEHRFRERLAEAAPGSAAYVEVLTQIARAQGLQRKFDAAHATLDAAAALLPSAEAGPGAARARVRYLLERGRVLNSARQPAQARPWFEAAWEAAQAAGEDFYAVDAAHMLGICAPPGEQIHWHEQALGLAERSAQPRARGWLGSLYNNLGWTYHDQGAFGRALELFEMAAALRAEQGQPTQHRIARWCIARCLRSLGRLEEALAAQLALLREHRAAGTSDGFVLEELGECLLRLGRADEARPYFDGAYAALAQDAWLAANEPERLARLRALAQEDSGG